MEYWNTEYGIFGARNIGISISSGWNAGISNLLDWNIGIPDQVIRSNCYLDF
jgi:hypothetical protein